MKKIIMPHVEKFIAKTKIPMISIFSDSYIVMGYLKKAQIYIKMLYECYMNMGQKIAI